MILYESLSGTRTVEIDITSVSAWFKPYIGWVGDANGQTLTIQTRASFDNGSTWTAYVVNTNNDELTDAFNESTESHADIIEVKQSLATTDNEVSPWIYQLFIYFPDFDPYLEASIPMITGSIDCYLHGYMDQITFPLFALDMTRDMAEYSFSADLDCELSFSFESHAGKEIDLTLPKLSVTCDVNHGYLAEMVSWFPFMQYNSFVGAEFKNTLPELTFVSSGKTDLHIDMSCTLQPFMFTSSFSFSPLADLILKLPTISNKITAFQGHTCNLNITIPKPYITQQTLTGCIGDIDLSTQPLSVRIITKETGPNGFTLTIPELYYNSSILYDFSNVLMYNKGSIR